MESRGGLRVGFDTASTTVKRFFNGDLRRKSQSKVQVRLCRRPHSNGRRWTFDSVSLPFFNELPDSIQTNKDGYVEEVLVHVPI